MSITIDLSNDLEAQLQREAEAANRSMEEVALRILRNALETNSEFPSLEEVVAKIKATSSLPPNVRPAQGSLAEALRNAPDDPDFDLDQWNRDWSAVESEIKAMTRSNDLAEGRR